MLADYGIIPSPPSRTHGFWWTKEQSRDFFFFPSVAVQQPFDSFRNEIECFIVYIHLKYSGPEWTNNTGWLQPAASPLDVTQPKTRGTLTPRLYVLTVRCSISASGRRVTWFRSAQLHTDSLLPASLWPTFIICFFPSENTITSCTLGSSSEQI